MFFRTIQGRIDQISQVMVIEEKNNDDIARYKSLNQWGEQLQSLHQLISNRLY